MVLKWLGVFFILVALASPILSQNYSLVDRESRDIILILDSSESMIQGEFDDQNISKSRFDVVKELAGRFIVGRSSDRVGLVSFADFSFVASPLTFDRHFLLHILRLQRLGLAGQKSAINDALLQGYTVLERSKSRAKIAILLTDGVDNMSKTSLKELENIITKSKVKLYVIGVGSEENYDLKTLKKIAMLGDGVYFEAKNSEFLEEIYTQIDRLETTKIRSKERIKKAYLFVYPLLLSILFLLFFIYYQTFYHLKRGAL